MIPTGHSYASKVALSFLMLFATSLCFASPSPAGDGEISGFSKSLRKIQTLISLKRWGAAEMKILDLLEKHRGKSCVFEKSTEISEMMKSCVFGRAWKAPQTDELLSGKLISYKRSSGSIKILYTPDKMKDFKSQEIGDPDNNKKIKVYIAPLLFDGPYVIDWKVKYSKSLKFQKNVLLVCLESNRCYIINLEPHYVISYEGEDSFQLLDHKDLNIKGDRLNLTVKVSHSRIQTYINHKKVLAAGKKAGHFGTFALTDTPFAELVVSGKIKPSWIQGLADKAREQARADFEKNYKPKDHLPSWFLAGKRGTVAMGGEKPFPGPDFPLRRRIMEAASNSLKKKAYDDGLEFLKSLDDDSISEALRCWLMTRFYDAQGRWDQALECCEKVCRLDPGFFEAQYKHARLLSASGRKEKALSEFRNLLDRFPNQALLYVETAALYLDRGRPGEAKHVLEKALGLGVAPAGAKELNDILYKALNGPSWDRKYEFESKHYRVYSDLDKRTCFEVSRIMEEAFLLYGSLLEKVEIPSGVRFPVYVFSGRTGYESYLGKTAGLLPFSTAGCYVPSYKQLLVLNLPDRDEMMRVARHEAFHQYLDCIMEHPPLWFNEGLAVYFQMAQRKGGKWRLGGIHKEFAHLLQKKDPLPLKEFIYRRDEAFRKDPSMSYAQSWAFVHLLLHSAPENRALFDALFEGLQGDVSTQQVLHRVFDPVDLDHMDRALKVHLSSME